MPGDPDQVAYVWFDALGNYLTALGYGQAEAPLLDRWWQPPTQRIHVVGKGITRFHAIYWPALLLSAGLPLPDRILVHGYLTLDGSKISKSHGPVAALDPGHLVETFGTDALRYHLLRHTRAHQDTDFTQARLAESYQNEFADQLGNLLHRTVTLAARTGDGVFEAPEPDAPCLAETADLGDRVEAAVRDFRLHEALDAIFAGVSAGNRYLEATEPWRIEDPRRKIGILSNAAELLRVTAEQLTPFLPETARRIRGRVGAGVRAAPGPPLFPRLGAPQQP